VIDEVRGQRERRKPKEEREKELILVFFKGLVPFFLNLSSCLIQ
jgi:hypothetical protein